MCFAVVVAAIQTLTGVVCCGCSYRRDMDWCMDEAIVETLTGVFCYGCSYRRDMDWCMDEAIVETLTGVFCYGCSYQCLYYSLLYVYYICVVMSL